MKILDIEAYGVPVAVAYLQVDDSLVVKDIIAWVVPAARAPEGWPEILVGSVVSGIGDVFPEAILDKAEILEASSVALIAK